MNRFARQRGAVAALAGFALGALPFTVHAGPPFITDDPEPVDFQHWEINTALTGSWRQGEASAGIPVVDINYGAAPDLQLHVQPRYSYERAEGGSQHGFDDTEIGVKYRLLNIRSGDVTWMLGTYPMYQAATGATRLGPGRGLGQLFVPLWLQRNSGKWSAYGGAGYRFNRGPDSRNSVFAGATLLYEVSDGLQLGGEVFHETPDSVGAKSTAGFNLGGIFNLRKNLNLLFSAGNSVNGDAATNRHLIFVGLQVSR